MMIRTKTTMLAVLCVVIAIAAGCSSGRVRAGDPSSITGGAALWMKTSDGESSHALYTIKPNGQIAFGGGHDAARNETTWFDVLTQEEAAALTAAFRAAGWFDGRPSVNPVSKLTRADSFEHEIRFAWPGGSWELEVDRGGGQVRPVREAVQQIFAQKRYGTVFDKLPEAGPQD